jgi:hypothetical protein
MNQLYYARGTHLILPDAFCYVHCLHTVFRDSRREVGGQGRAVACHLEALTNTTHGPLPPAVRRAVQACIEPVLLYGADTWYPGGTSPSWPRSLKEVPSRIKDLVQRMGTRLHLVIRAILPVWVTTPTTALHRESDIPPVAQLLGAARLSGQPY